MSVARPNVVLTDDKDAKRLEVHKKTRLCKFFAVGACTRGSSCAFAHGSDQLRDQPDFSKTRLCADFVEMGRCVAGQACKFAHSKSELRPGSAAKLGRPSAKSGSEASKPKEKSQVETAAQVLQNLRVQHALHEQAALKLMLQSACARPPVKAPPKETKEKDVECCPGNDSTSFSRQTTWEGMETASAGFSRDSSAASAEEDMWSSTPASRTDRELPNLIPVAGVERSVKNTFLEFHEELPEESSMQRSRSLPSLLVA